MKRFIFILQLLIICLFTSCASKPEFKGKGDLCGLIVDENSRPVKDFVVSCCNKKKGIGTVPVLPVITNESGIFVFYGLSSGTYSISGEKNNYVRIKEIDYDFNDRTKIICLQTKSLKEAVKKAEELILLGEKEEAEEMLNSIVLEKDSREECLVQAYSFFTARDTKEKKIITERIKKYSGKDSDFFRSYAEKLMEDLK